MSSDVEDRFFNGASIGALQADNATLSRLRERAVYELCVAGIDRAFLTILASEKFSSMFSAFIVRVSAVSQPLVAFYSNALIASDVDASKLNFRLLADETIVVFALKSFDRLKCRS